MTRVEIESKEIRVYYEDVRNYDTDSAFVLGIFRTFGNRRTINEIKWGTRFSYLKTWIILRKLIFLGVIAKVKNKPVYIIKK